LSEWSGLEFISITYGEGRTIGGYLSGAVFYACQANNIKSRASNSQHGAKAYCKGGCTGNPSPKLIEVMADWV